VLVRASPLWWPDSQGRMDLIFTLKNKGKENVNRRLGIRSGAFDDPTNFSIRRLERSSIRFDQD
ncbi:MAG: hypothetical protein ACR2RA_19055, partial [Geminicoccaceae bacterium]